MSNEGKAGKNDKVDNKPDYSLIPKVLMDQLAFAMMAEQQKYGRYNYLSGHAFCQLTAAATRHLKLMEQGEDLDADTSERIGTDVSHAACVAANMLMLLHQAELGTLIDDRYKSTNKDLTKTSEVKTSKESVKSDELLYIEYSIERPFYGGGTIETPTRRYATPQELEELRQTFPDVRVLKRP